MKPIPCRICRKTFTPTQSGRFYCSRECYYESKRGPRKENVQYRMVTVKGHPIAPPGGVLPVARVVLYDKLGPGPHPCHWCSNPVQWRPEDRYAKDALMADHLDWNATNDAPENLVPSCNACNGHRRSSGGSQLIEDGELWVRRGRTRTRAVQRNCEYCGGHFLTIPAEIRNGKGRFCSRSCARRTPR